MNKILQSNHRLYLILLLLPAAGMSACSSSDLGEPHDVAYFVQHNEARKAMLAKCANNPGKYMAEQNCINATEAKRKYIAAHTQYAPETGGYKPFEHMGTAPPNYSAKERLNNDKGHQKQ